MHERQIIRDKVFTLLDGNVFFPLPATPIKVFKTRFVPFWTENLPALGLYMLQDDSNAGENAPRWYERDLQLNAQIFVEEKIGIITDDIIDDIAEQIETILYKNPLLDNLAKDSKLVSTAISFKSEGERLFVAANMIWNIEYDTDAPAAQTLDGLNTANIDISTAGVTVDIQAKVNF